MTTIGVLHPGAMGAAVGAALVSTGHDVIWASAGRSQQSRQRARDAGLRDVVRLEALIAESEMVLSICPPDASLQVARSAMGLSGIFVDANAISPDTSVRVGEMIGGGQATASRTCCMTNGSCPRPAYVDHLQRGRRRQASTVDHAGHGADQVAEHFRGIGASFRRAPAGAQRSSLPGNPPDFMRRRPRYSRERPPQSGVERTVFVSVWAAWCVISRLVRRGGVVFCGLVPITVLGGR